MMLGHFKKMLALCGYPQRFRSSLVLAQSAVPASVTGTLAETTLATISLPALGPNSQVRVYAFYSLTNNTNAKTVSARLAGVGIGQYNLASSASCTMLRTITNRNATNSQLLTPATATSSLGGSSSGFLTSTVNTSVPTALTLTAILTNAGDTVTLESYTVEILNP